MISFFIAPENAPQRHLGTTPPQSAPRLESLDRLDRRIVESISRCGHYGDRIWTILNSLALEEAPKQRSEQRVMRLELWARLRRLLKEEFVFLFNRHMVTARKIHSERKLRRKRIAKAGSALIPPDQANSAIPANHLSVNLFRAVEAYERKKKTESDPRPMELSHAARLLARIRHGKRPRTGLFHGVRARRGCAIRLRDGRQAFLYGCTRNLVIWSLDPLVLLMDLRKPGVEWGVAPEREIALVKNPAAAVLGAAKRGHSELPSIAKAESARRNGRRPCRPGRRRGRPRKVFSAT
jgi:hypothetical protein